jgi:hypothetical protein
LKAFGDAAIAVKRHIQAISSRQTYRVVELSQWCEPATTERGDVAQKAPGQFVAAFLVAALFPATNSRVVV